MTRWQQNALILSATWAFAVTAYLRHQEMPKAEQHAMRAYFVCAEHARDRGEKPETCLEKVEDDWNDWMNRQWGRIGAIVLVPIGLGWLSGLAGLHAWRRYKPRKEDEQE